MVKCLLGVGPNLSLDFLWHLLRLSLEFSSTSQQGMSYKFSSLAELIKHEAWKVPIDLIVQGNKLNKP
jgi:hypothetical protein